MKQVKVLLILCALFTINSIVISCGDTAAKKGTEYTAAYICPMHCKGSGSDQPGTCPKCEMDYEKNKNSKATKTDANANHDGHDHDAHHHDGHDHDGHEHSEHDHDGHNH